MNEIRPVRTEADYDWALSEIERYFIAEPARGTADADRFDILSSLIETYENRHWTIAAADPIDTITETMSARGLTQSSLAQLLGSRARASEILARKRPLTLPMIQRINREWNIPADLLIAPYRLADAA
jgi:HTH-type transcriptional regulator / antitoxin HigA